MKLKITRSVSDDSLYAVSDNYRTRPMRSAELTRWLLRLGSSDADVTTVMNLKPADSIELEVRFIAMFPGEHARAS